MARERLFDTPTLVAGEQVCKKSDSGRWIGLSALARKKRRVAKAERAPKSADGTGGGARLAPTDRSCYRIQQGYTLGRGFECPTFGVHLND